MMHSDCSWAQLWGSCIKSEPRGGGRALRTYVLDMVEAEWGAPPRVLEGFRGEGLVMAMDEAVKGEEMLAGHRGHGVGTHRLAGVPRLLSARPLSCRHTGRWGSLELAEDVGVFGRDAGCLQDGHPEGEGAAQAQMVQGSIQGPVQGGFLGAVQEEAFWRHGCWKPRVEQRGRTSKGS